MKKCPGPDGLTAELCQIFQALTATLRKLVLNINWQAALPSSLYEASVTLIPKPDEGTTKIKPNFSDKHRQEISQLSVCKLNSMKHKSINHDRVSLTQEYKDGICKIVNAQLRTWSLCFTGCRCLCSKLYVGLFPQCVFYCSILYILY